MKGGFLEAQRPKSSPEHVRALKVPSVKTPPQSRCFLACIRIAWEGYYECGPLGPLQDLSRSDGGSVICLPNKHSRDPSEDAMQIAL